MEPPGTAPGSVVPITQRKAAATEDSSKNADVPTNPELDVLKKILAELRKDGGAALGQGPASKG